MKLVREQRISMVGSNMVAELTRIATAYRRYMQEGVDEPAQEGYPELKASGAEVKASMGDNVARVEAILALILDQP